MMFTGEEVLRFWGKVAMPEEGCWEWQAGCSARGYGHFYVRRGSYWQNVRAHRVALSLKLGRPLTLNALHSCDNRRCVRPSHLREGTQAENVQDTYDRGRVTRKGTANGRAKLSFLLADRIREEYVPHSRTHGARAMAKKYGVGVETIRRIHRREVWN